jgi:hypothetical protein
VPRTSRYGADSVGTGRTLPAAALVIEGGEVELGEAVRVDQRVDGGDPAAGDDESLDRIGPTAEGDQDTGVAVDQDGPSERASRGPTFAEWLDSAA